MPTTTAISGTTTSSSVRRRSCNRCITVFVPASAGVLSPFGNFKTGSAMTARLVLFLVRSHCAADVVPDGFELLCEFGNVFAAEALQSGVGDLRAQHVKLFEHRRGGW